jgi:hypothetical protein
LGVFTKYHVEVTYLRRQNIFGPLFWVFVHNALGRLKKLFFVRLTDAKPRSILEFTPDGHYRTIKIEARKAGDKLEVRARKGYYARAASSLTSDPAEEARESSVR